MEALAKNQQHTVTIEGYSSEGLGIARIHGQVVFVHGGVRGEVCQIQILKVLKQIAFAKVISTTADESRRQTPDCPYFGQCGGCAVRHLTYAEELTFKKQKVQDALTRLGGSSVTVETIHGAKNPLHYRNKVQYPVSPQGEAGFYRQRTHQVTPIATCLIQKDCAERIAKEVTLWLKQYRIPAYQETTGKGLLRHIYVRTNRQGEALLCLVCNGSKVPHEAELIEQIRTACPEVVGILLNVHTQRNNVVLGDTYRTLWGADSLLDTLCGLSFQLSVPSFYQVNPEQTEVLYERARDFADLHGTETVLDLYCGIGTISLYMAQKAKSVIGAEIVPEAIADAKENAKRNGVENVSFFCGDAGEIATKLQSEGLHPNVVCVDPPRKGLFPNVVDTIVAMQPERIVYISCDPATLGRDCKLFAMQGYQVTKAEAVDMFAGSHHVETVVLMSRMK